MLGFPYREVSTAARLLLCGLFLCAFLSSCRQGEELADGASGRALLEAVKLGDNQKVALLLEEGAYAEVRDEKGDTPLLYAVKTGNLQVVRMLLKQGVDREARSGNGKGPLELALDSGNKDMVQCLFDGGVSPDEIGRDNNPLLLKAVRLRDIKTIKLLLHHGVTSGAAGKDGSTALHVAAGEGLMDCMRILLDAGADVNARDDAGATPLWRVMHVADPVQRLRGMELLLAAGADANIRGREKKSLLVETVRRKLYQESIELINYGADVNDRGAGNLSPLGVAHAGGDRGMMLLLLCRGGEGTELMAGAIEREDVELLRLLFDFGVRPESWRSSSRDSMIASCVRKGNLELAELCLNHGADPSARGLEGERPLHMGIAMRDEGMVRLVLGYGADPNQYFARPASKKFLALTKEESMQWFLKNDRRLTPLMMAMNNGDLGIIAALLDYGAKKNVYSGRYHLYPVNFASRRGDVKAMQVLFGKNPEEEKYHAVLDLSDQRVRLYNAKGEVVFSSRVSTGKSGFRTPKGTYVITDKHRQHNSTIYGSSMPYFQRLSCAAFGFHAGNCPGYPASHGCIRMPYSAAKKFFRLTSVGTRVVIQR